MADIQEKTTDVQGWFKITWPIITFVVMLTLAGLGGFSKLKVEMAVIQSENKHLEKELIEMKSDVKDIKNFLMNPVR